MTSKRIKPCPFCGGEAKIYGKREWPLWIACEFCAGQTDGYDTEEEAIEAWNRRVGEEQR